MNAKILLGIVLSGCYFFSLEGAMANAVKEPELYEPTLLELHQLDEECTKLFSSNKIVEQRAFTKNCFTKLCSIFDYILAIESNEKKPIEDSEIHRLKIKLTIKYQCNGKVLCTLYRSIWINVLFHGQTIQEATNIFAVLINKTKYALSAESFMVPVKGPIYLHFPDVINNHYIAS